MNLKYLALFGLVLSGCSMSLPEAGATSAAITAAATASATPTAAPLAAQAPAASPRPTPTPRRECMIPGGDGGAPRPPVCTSVPVSPAP